MFILNEYNGSRVSLEYHDGHLYHVLLRIADIARGDGFTILIDQRINGKIEINLDEPWNHILIEILAGLNFKTIIENKTIIITLPQ
jgi:hypothetical protein